jgi:RHS repeat-associated protein
VATGAPIDLRFPGQWFQAEAGLYQNWMRDYDPTLGRYIEADPLGLVDGASVYGYVRGNPLRWTDPRGENPAAAVGAFCEINPAVCAAAGRAVAKICVEGAKIVAGAIVGWFSAADEGCACEDDCQKRYADIETQMNIVKKRLSEYYENKLKLPEYGPYPPGSRSGHRTAIVDAQRGLRNRLESAAAAGCNQIPSDAWWWATRPI